MSFTYFNKFFDGATIQKKLIVINLSVTTVALLFAVIMAVAGEYFTKRDFIVESLQVQAKMVGNNTTAALVFNDKNGAEDTLQALSASPNVHTAIIYDATGEIFANYVKDGLVISNDKLVESHSHDEGSSSKAHFHEGPIVSKNKIHIIEKIILDNELIGSLFIQADVSGLYEDIIHYLIYTASVALLGLALASLLLLKLRKSITRPLKKLTELMSFVIQNNDYSTRVNNYSEDEIGVLSRSFDKMLTHIQANDERLEHELSERYKAEKHLDTLAYNDLATGLPNRHFFQQQLDGAVERARATNKKMVLLFLDLDNFKIVNDTAGHKTGDLLLKDASLRLSESIRSNDHICRIGGDEFAIIIENINDVDAITTVTNKCIESLAEPFVFGMNRFFIGVSIGISVCPDDATTANELLVNADMAMYEAKVRGKNNFQFFNQKMNDDHSHKYHLEDDLRQAVDTDQIELYYQPQIDSASGSIVGVEALMRWNHPVKGMIPPSVFIPVAEESGLILPLGKWLIETVCQHGKKLVDSGLKDITIAINISAIQIRESCFIENITNAIKSTGLDPKCLEFELTESVLMEDSELVIDKFMKLNDMGLKMAIDDFGTGFSSMSYLKKFPISKLKIDKSFVSGLPNSEKDIAIVRAIIAMAHGLNINVIAEGVEDIAQAEFLHEHECDMFQGYYYAKPMPFSDLLNENGLQKNSKSKLRLIKGK